MLGTRGEQAHRCSAATRLLVALIHRCLQCATRILVNSYLAYAPIPPRTWLDAHRIYAFARERGLHERPISADEPAATPERAYLQALLLALANPYGFLQGQLDTVIRYVQEYSHWVKLTDVAPVHRMAKAVAIIPVGHDFPPFSASKGGSIEGSKIFLLAFDLAFQIQEQVRKLEAGGDFPTDVGTRRGVAPPLSDAAEAAAAAMGDSAGAPVQPAAVAGARRHVHRARRRLAVQPRPARRCRGRRADLPPLTHCQVINHTPAGYALRQTDRIAAVAAHRRADRAARRGRPGPQVAIVRWFRNTMRGSGLEFGCELLSDNPEAAAAAPENAADGAKRMPVVVLPVQPGKADADDACRRSSSRGRVRRRSGDGAHARPRNGLRGADQARRAGSGLRDLRLHAGQLSR